MTLLMPPPIYAVEELKILKAQVQDIARGDCSQKIIV